MTIKEVHSQEYARIFNPIDNVFGTVAFNELNSPKVDEVSYLIGLNDVCEPRFGIVAGHGATDWRAPFSAPFFPVAVNGAKIGVAEAAAFLDAVKKFVCGAPFTLVLPPRFYDPEVVSAFFEAANGRVEVVEDVNYHYDLGDFQRWEQCLNRAARKNFARSSRVGFCFSKTDDLKRAYDVIKTNRDQHGYNLAMTFEQVRETVNLVEADFFVLSLPQSDGAPAEDVAAAIVYRVAPGIAQVIYWGDVAGYSQMRPMNQLPYEVFGYYARLGFRIVDVGPSSTNGVRNEGLCRFKESLGCRPESKFTLKF